MVSEPIIIRRAFRTGYGARNTARVSGEWNVCEGGRWLDVTKDSYQIEQSAYGALLAYTVLMEFVEAPPFTRDVSEYLSEDAYREPQTRLSENPEMGDLMPGTGGFRKMRWADAGRGKGRGRIADSLLPLLLRSSNLADDSLCKDEVSDLTAQQKKALEFAIEEELAARSAKRRTRLRG